MPSAASSAALAMVKLRALQLDRHGWLKPAPSVSLIPSPNCDKRPADVAVSLLVMHNITLPPGEFDTPHVQGLFTNTLDYSAHPWLERLRGLHVSAHFFVRRDGSIVQFVSTETRAWHAGVSSFNGRERCNDFSIGIEVEGTDDLPYTDEQYEALASLTPALVAGYPIAHVRGHEHIAPVRKTDPGPSFDWRRFEQEGPFWQRQLPPV